MLLLLLALLALINAIASAYYIWLSVDTTEGKTGSYIFSGIHASSALLFIILAIIRQ